MGIDLNSLINGAVSSSAQTGQDLWQSVGQGALAYVEGQAISVIKTDQDSHAKQAQSTVQNILQRPTSAGSFGEYLSNLFQNPVLANYGPYILFVVAAIVFFL